MMPATSVPARAVSVVTVSIKYEHDVVLARQRARQLAHHLGFDGHEQVRFATAVSELARNAFRHAGGGKVTFSVEQELDNSRFVARVMDDGPGISNIDRILRGEYKSETGMGMGIRAARKLADTFALQTEVGRGTSVTIGKTIWHRTALSGAEIEEIGRLVSAEDANGPYEEIQRQNQDLLEALDEVREGKTAVERLNVELAETNRGVLALYGELDDRATELKALSETKTRFLSDVSHELRTPLTSIINLARLLASHVDGPLSDEQGRQVQLVEKAALWLVDMVSDLLDIAKIEAGATALRIESVDVNDLLSTLRGMSRPLVTNDALSLVIEESSPLTLLTDEQRVSQILRNLVANAIKFTAQGEVRLSVSEDDEDVLFRVADTGSGIADEDLGRIFEEYAQVDAPVQRRLRGTGLGLPLSRKLAELMHGTLNVESTIGAGSVFTLRIPRTLAEPKRG